jgi:O-antigen/teichoic acid export membrane protein
VRSAGPNIAANFVARAAVGLMTLAFTPAYVSLLGIQAYGVVGTFAAFQAILFIFDFGIGLTLNRQLARLATQGPSGAQEMRDAVRTFEVVYWAVGLLLGSAVVVAATFVGSAWFQSSDLSPAQVSSSLSLMGVALVVQWPSLLYLGGLLGLQRQLSSNVILTIAALIRGAGSIVVLTFVSPTLDAFFVWQVIASVCQTILLRVRLDQMVPGGTSGGRFRATVIQSNMMFAADVTGITILGTLLIQLDKVILSRAVSLSDFGYYVLAGTIATSVNLFVSPVFNGVFPRLTATTATGEIDETRRTYHEACQVMSVLIWPLSLVLIAFAPDVLYVWMNAVPSERTVWLVRILVAGTALNGLMNIPYGLMLASGWSRLPLLLNLVAVLVLVPFIVYMTSRFGTIGGALAWLLLNVGYVSFGIAAMHTKLLRGEAWTWYAHDVGLPLLGAVLSVMAFRLVSAGGNRGETAAVLLLAGAATVCASALASSFVRSVVRGWIRGRRIWP